ncbi:MAG TPA: preprotein translocase subunit YajC [Thermoanaerobaculia bacterium]
MTMNAIALFQSTGGGAAAIANFLPVIAIGLVFYFMVIGPANKQRKNQQEMLSALKKGDRVITSGGIYGTVQGVEPEAVYLKIAENVKVKVSRSAISGLVAGEAESQGVATK